MKHENRMMDILIVKFEKACQKHVDKAPEDVATSEKELLKPSFTATERSLMSVVEEVPWQNSRVRLLEYIYIYIYIYIYDIYIYDFIYIYIYIYTHIYI